MKSVFPPIQSAVQFPIRWFKGGCHLGKHAWSQMEHAHVHTHDAAGSSDGLRLLAELERCKPGVGFACKTKDVGLDTFAECLEEDSHSRPFSMSCGASHYCASPLCVYAAKVDRK